MDLSQFATVGTGQPGIPTFQGGAGAGGADWTPATREEREYYEMLFRMADKSGSGRLAGQAAVEFFRNSRLDFGVLKTVWTLSDIKRENYLEREGFCVAMRLIAMAQCAPGAPLTKEALLREGTKPLPIARFDGVPPAPVQISQGAGAGAGAGEASGDPYLMSAAERSKYEGLFPTYDSNGDGFIMGQEAVALFQQSGLGRAELRQVWELSDVDRDSRLSKAEFCCAMHLIVCATKKRLPVPSSLPPSLASLVGAASQAPAPAPVAQRAANISDAFSGLDSTSAAAASASASMPPPAEVTPAPTPATPSQQLSRNASATSTSSFGAMGMGSSLQQQQQQVQPAASSAASIPSAGSPEVQQLMETSESLAVVAKEAAQGTSKALEAQRGGIEVLRGLIQKLQAEKVSISSMLAGAREEMAENEKLLGSMSSEVEQLQRELGGLRSQRQQGEQALMGSRDKLMQMAAQKQALTSQLQMAGVSEGMHAVQLNASPEPGQGISGATSPQPLSKTPVSPMMSPDMSLHGQGTHAMDSMPAPVPPPAGSPLPPVPPKPANVGSGSLAAPMRPDSPFEADFPSAAPPPPPVPPKPMSPPPDTSDPFGPMSTGGGGGGDAFDSFPAPAGGANGNGNRKGMGFENSDDPFAASASGGVGSGFDAFPAEAADQGFDAFK
ncbi:unnamed protein product [Chrysoparadoxa australica]